MRVRNLMRFYNVTVRARVVKLLLSYLYHAPESVQPDPPVVGYWSVTLVR
jgi:hypothetical protein